MINKNIKIAHYRLSDNKIQTVEEHLVKTAKLCKDYASKIGLPFAGELLGLTHDFGKNGLKFQRYIYSELGLIGKSDPDYLSLSDKEKDHSTAGGQLIFNSKNETLKLISLCIMSHHSGLIDCVSAEKSNFNSRIIKNIDLKDCISNCDSTILNNINLLINNVEDISTFFKNKHPNIHYYELGFLCKILLSCLIDADRMDTIDFVNNLKYNFETPNISWNDHVKKIESAISNFKENIETNINKIRRSVSDECKLAASRPKGIFTLTVPTGGGKTLSSLRFALHHANIHNMDRIISISPFISIIEQNAKVARDILGDDSILEYHSNIEHDSNEEYTHKISYDAWDSNIIYTTGIQLLEILFGSKTSSARKLHKLINSIIIFDEIQTLPIKCIHIFNNAINFLVDYCGCTVVLCTATQPLLHIVDPKRGALNLSDNSEIVGDVNTLFESLNRTKITNKIKKGAWQNLEIIDLIKENVKESNSCLTIVNTKKIAKELFEELKNYYDGVAFHLSTNMCSKHRNDIFSIIKQKLNDNEPVVCISTQLIEAGVDIDFGSVIRVLAGLDSILQAAGRCNRHGKRSIGNVYIINVPNENLGLLEDIKIGQEETERILTLNKNCNLLDPNIMKQYNKNLFSSRKHEMVYKVKQENYSLLDLLSNNNYHLSKHDKSSKLNQSFKLAADTFRVIEPTRSVIVPYKDGKNIINDLCKSNITLNKKIFKLAQKYIINIFSSSFENLKKLGRIHKLKKDVDIYYLDEEYYNDNFGLTYD